MRKFVANGGFVVHLSEIVSATIAEIAQTSSLKMLKPKHYPNFSVALQSGLDRKGWSPSELAKRLSTHPSSVTRWLAGSVPHRATLNKILKLLDLPEGEPADSLPDSLSAPPSQKREAAAEQALTQITASMSTDQIMAMVEALAIGPEAGSPGNQAAVRRLMAELKERLPANS